MTPRERYLETMLFGTPNRIPLQPGGPRESTLRAWRQQGLPADVHWYAYLLQQLGLQPEPPALVGAPASFRMIPEFEEKVLEHKDGRLIVQDWMGATVEISDQFDVTYLRMARDFVTRSWIKCPVETREDWERMRARYVVDTPGRFPDDFADQCRALARGEAGVTLHVNGPFWQLREWLGFEGLCMMMADDPAFVRDMIRFWTDFISDILDRIQEHVPLTRLGISEDMAYKAHSMISPAMTREFLVPSYLQWGEQVRAKGCPIIDMDSDGYIGELIPIWIEAGINVCNPIEVAAHNDIVDFRRQFGTRMAYVGGIDKRAIAAGGAVMEAEVLRVVPPLLKGGGFIPGCDHGVPSDISWPNYLAYSRLLAQLCGWL